MYATNITFMINASVRFSIRTIHIRDGKTRFHLQINLNSLKVPVTFFDCAIELTS